MHCPDFRLCACGFAVVWLAYSNSIEHSGFIMDYFGPGDQFVPWICS